MSWRLARSLGAKAEVHSKEAFEISKEKAQAGQKKDPMMPFGPTTAAPPGRVRGFLSVFSKLSVGLLKLL